MNYDIKYIKMRGKGIRVLYVIEVVISIKQIVISMRYFLCKSHGDPKAKIKRKKNYSTCTKRKKSKHTHVKKINSQINAVR